MELLASQQLQYGGQVGHKSPLSGSSTVILKTGFWILAKLCHCQNQSCNFVWILQNAFQISFIWVSVTLNFAKCISDVIYLGICDVEYYNCIAVLSMCLKRKMEWPQSPLTLEFWGCLPVWEGSPLRPVGSSPKDPRAPRPRIWSDGHC